MSAILIALLALVSISIALYPLFEARNSRFAFRPNYAIGPDAIQENLLSQREATYGAIKDLEFDHAQGKISATDYKMLREKYETKALKILAELESVSKPFQAEDALPLHLPNNGCPQCGEPIALSDKFCHSCGAPLGARCHVCGAALGTENKFCACCGVARAAPLIKVRGV